MADDLQLLDKWRAGDKHAGDELVRRHFGAVQRFFRNKAWAEGEDLTQTTFMRCVAMRDRFEGRSSFRTFLFSVARHVLYEHYRSKHSATGFDPKHNSVIDIDPSPSQVVADLQWQQVFFDALRRTPVDMQVVLELYYWEGLGTQEIAEVVEIPRGTVKSRLYHARIEVKKECEKLGVELSPAVSMPGWARDFEGAGT